MGGRLLETIFKILVLFLIKFYRKYRKWGWNIYFSTIWPLKHGLSLVKPILMLISIKIGVFWKKIFYPNSSRVGVWRHYDPQNLHFWRFFTVFDFLAPLTSFKPSKTYIDVDQHKNWSVLKKIFTPTAPCGGYDVIMTPKTGIFDVFCSFRLFSPF